MSRLGAALSGRYVIEREAGAGGMATVYVAHDTKHDRKVALKVLKPELAAVLGADRFVQEIKTTAALQHPHILPLFDSGTADGFLYYVMPFIDGETLRTKLDRETQLGVDEAVRITRDVADALDYAHRHGVIHRDIKPENILLHDGRPMVADFGIALAVSAAAGGRMTETGLSLGTPHYMSPEQATAEKEISARSDVYSLGSVLYEMLAGNPPHVGSSAQQIIMKIIAESAEAVTKYRKAVPPNVAAAVAKSLEKLPADRFESAKAFADALGNPGYTNGSHTALSQTSARARRQRMASAATIVVAIAATAAVTWWLATRRATDSLAVQFAFSVAPNQPLGSNPGRQLALSPDGRTLVYATADSVGRLRLFLRRLDDLRHEPIAGTENAQYPFFSPDGRTVGFVAGRQLKKIPIEGGTATPLTDAGVFSGANWGPAGVIVSFGGLLKMVPSAGGPAVPLAPGDTARGYWPLMLPDGRHAVFTTTISASDAMMAVIDVATARQTKLNVAGVPVGVVGGELVFVRPDGALMAAPFDAGALRMTGTGRVVVNEVQRSGLAQSKVAVSMNGSLAYVRFNATRQLVVVDERGATRPLPIPPARMYFPRLSPNGRQLLVEVQDGARFDVWIYDIASGAARRVAVEGNTNNRAEWTRDGSRIIFRSDRQGPNTAYWTQPADGSGAAQLLFASPGKGIWEGLLAADGQTFIYRTGTLGAADIWYRRMTGDTAEKPIATTPFDEFAPNLSPDGRWIAYQTGESGVAEVVVRPFPGPGAQFPVSVGGGSTPVWSRDGRKLFYNNGNEFIEATVTTTPAFAVIARRRLFDGEYFINAGHASFDVFADGKSFVMLSPTAGIGEQIVVVHNWQAELRRRTKDAAP